MNEIKTLKYQCEVIPEDAFDTQVETVDFGDQVEKQHALQYMPDLNVRIAATRVNLYSHDLN